MAESNIKLPKKYESSFYSQWERKRQVAAVSTPATQTRSSTKTCATTITVGPRPIPQIRNGRYGNKPLLQDPTEERCKLLQMKVSSARTTLGSLKVREEELILHNMTMKDKIMEAEKPEHDAVKKLLRKYEKFRGGMSFLCDNFQSAVNRETTDMNQLQAQLDKELMTVETQVRALDKELTKNQHEVHVLNNYKDKEYPVKAIRIAELMAELDQVEMGNEDEASDLERIIDTELQKLISKEQKVEMELKESALVSVLRKMHPSIKEMAEQNQVMLKEIVYHQKEIAKLVCDIENLKDEVRKLLLHPKTNVRLQVFPEFFKYDTKCTPDMDVILDIPTVKVLPI